VDWGAARLDTENPPERGFLDKQLKRFELSTFCMAITGATEGAAAHPHGAGPTHESESGDARTKLRRLSALAASSDEPLRIDLAVRDWARREQTVAERLREVDNRRMDYMRSLFGAFCPDEDDGETRCTVFYSL